MKPWSIRFAFNALGCWLLVSSVVGFFALGWFEEEVAGDVVLSDAGWLFATEISALSGGLFALLYAARHTGLEAFRLGPMRKEDALLSVSMVVPVLGFGFAYSGLLGFLGVETSPQQTLQAMLDTTSVAALMVGLFGTMVGAPLIEEMLFRGCLQPPMVERFGPTVGIGSVALLFGLLHLSDAWAVIPCVVIGGVAGWLRHRSGGLGAPVLFHGMNNAIAVGLTVLIP
jgi:membrane protease YdiL (CAAX protease family)